MNLTIPKCLATVLACGSILLSGEAEGANGTNKKNVLQLLKNGSYIQSTGKITLKTGPLTMATWIKLDDDQCYGLDSRTILSIGNMALSYDTANSTLNFTYRHSQYNPSTYKIAAPDDGEWHHLVVTLDATNSLVLYLDGVAREIVGQSGATSVTLGSIYSNAAAVSHVGYSYSSYKNYGLGGALAEMSVWTRALSTAEVIAIKGARPSQADLANGCVAYWPFDEGDEGSAVRDLMGTCALTISKPACGKLLSTSDFPDFVVGDDKTYYSAEMIYPTNAVAIVVSGATLKDGKFEENTTATFTASAKDSALRFVRWYGDVPADQVSNPSVTVLFDSNKSFAPYFETVGWTYDAETKVLSDGYWRLKASVVDETGLKITSVAGMSKVPVLDLRKTVRGIDDSSYDITSIYGTVFEWNTLLEELRLPEMLVSNDLIPDLNTPHGTFYGCSKLKKVTPCLPSSMRLLGELMFKGCSSLSGSVVLGGGEDECVVRETNVQGFGKSSRYGDQFNGTGIQDVRVCANVKRLPYCVFSGCSSLTNVVFEKGGVTDVATNAFANCKKVVSFTMPQRPWIAATAFSGWTSNQCRFVIHAADPGWSAYMGESTNFIAWSALDAATREGYKAKFPGTRSPLGLSLTLPKNQWLCADGAPGLTVLVK